MLGTEGLEEYEMQMRIIDSESNLKTKAKIKKTGLGSIRKEIIVSLDH